MQASKRSENFPGVHDDAGESPGPGHFTAVDTSMTAGIRFDKAKRYGDIDETPGPGTYDA